VGEEERLEDTRRKMKERRFYVLFKMKRDGKEGRGKNGDR
jgi:hypothetical protein